MDDELGKIFNLKRRKYPITIVSDNTELYSGAFVLSRLVRFSAYYSRKFVGRQFCLISFQKFHQKSMSFSHPSENPTPTLFQVSISTNLSTAFLHTPSKSFDWSNQLNIIVRRILKTAFYSLYIKLNLFLLTFQLCLCPKWCLCAWTFLIINKYNIINTRTSNKIVHISNIRHKVFSSSRRLSDTYTNYCVSVIPFIFQHIPSPQQ